MTYTTRILVALADSEEHWLLGPDRQSVELVEIRRLHAYTHTCTYLKYLTSHGTFELHGRGYLLSRRYDTAAVKLALPMFDFTCGKNSNINGHGYGGTLHRR